MHWCKGHVDEERKKQQQRVNISSTKQNKKFTVCLLAPSCGQRRIFQTSTLCVLSCDKGLDECVGGLSVEGQSVTEGRQLGTFLQERLLQTVSSSVEILLRKTKHVT